MRVFNTEGPNDPKLHYTVIRHELLDKGMKKVDQGKYFTIFAPRQSGKTTYFKMLIEIIKEKTLMLPIWISFENFMTVKFKEFYEVFKDSLEEELDISVDFIPDTGMKMEKYFKMLSKQVGKKIILIIDEFDGVPEAVVNDLMHTFRKMYHKKDRQTLHSIILVGVRNITGVNLDNASPFNIADEITVPYFSPDEVRFLINQYVEETGQEFEDEVIDEIIFNTGGQPGMVNAICRELVEVEVPDLNETVKIEAFRKVLNKFFTVKIDKNISNIVNKARQEKDMMLKILFEEEVPFSIYDERIRYLNVNGVVSNKDGVCVVEPPIYKKALISVFKPILNGERIHYISPYESFKQFVIDDKLNMRKIIESYRQYVKRRGFRAFDTENLKEGACHYSFDNYISFFMDRIGGTTFIETPTGRGRMDIIILYKEQRYVIEIKRFIDEEYMNRGKRQLAKYLSSEGLEEGYYVVFSSLHKSDEDLYSEETVEGRKIYSWIIRTNFEIPSKS